MKSITKTFALLICSLFFITACSENSTPELNKQYTQLPNDLSDMLDKPVVEVFSLTCGHCLQMEKFLPEIETRINQPIGKVHVTFNESAQMAAMFYYAAEMQSQDGKVAPEMMHDLFNIYHAEQDKSSDERKASLVQAYTERGMVSPYDLSKEQQEELFGRVGDAIKISEKGMINSVPTFIVNGKYMVLTSAHNDVDAIANTINYLLTQG
ncbi:thiol-disulfide isomerase [Vibrio ishigakensis]|uniref:Thiol-disulfide isomerase n=1 Tax=Vibrio ishigakensis TaxID=1481914 RepID=A0A0B8P556_9VIBR|nr:thiol:disulfide interchange protein DsbA/DsbL [Vibrio ishigakensis]GAM59732.1 thiol-disulfide isomerase [Vibrio ishigakensis]